MKKALTAIKFALAALGILSFTSTAQAAYTDDCITFSSAAAFTLKTYNRNWNGTLWTSTDKTNWTEWKGDVVSAAQTGGMGNYHLYVRGSTDNTKIAGAKEGWSSRWVLTGSDIACTGNIETLRGATGDQPAPTAMDIDCYSHMFYGCTSLTEAPALTAMPLTKWCYTSMFEGCTSLTNVPALPRRVMAPYCYSGMFSGCTSLTQAPALPAMTLAEGCYYGMFYGCTALTSAPALPATTLAGYCYYKMFADCTSLEVNTTAPGKEWRISVTSQSEYWGYDMFTGTAGTLQGWPSPNATYYIANAPKEENCITFSSASSFTLRTDDGNKHWDGTLWTSTDKINWTTWYGSSVVAAKTGDTGNYKLYVRGDSNNTKITGDNSDAKWLLAGAVGIACSGNIETLRGATGNAPSSTPMAKYCYYGLFDSCTALTEAPALPAMTLAEECYCFMFYGCTSLTEAPALPATTLATQCYGGMFNDCTTLTNVPALPATTLADFCYAGMFYGCTALEVNAAVPGKEWKIPATSTTASEWGTDMFTGTAGTLQSQPALNTTYYIKSAPAQKAGTMLYLR